MKLVDFKHEQNYLFSLTFANGECKVVDLQHLLEKHLDVAELSSARLDKDWGCLEFKDGMVDIEPKTLYRYANKETNQLPATASSHPIGASQTAS